MRLAGDDGVNGCDRSKCNPFRIAVECHPNCFVASCDWHRSQCQAQKDRMKQCPLYDAAVFASVNAAQLVYGKGGSVDGHDSCANSTCQRPDTVPSDFNWTVGAVGPHAITFSKDYAWLVTYDSGGLDRDLHALTLDVWVNVDPSLDLRGYVASWELFGVFVLPFADLGFQVGVEKGGVLSFSTPTYLCTNGDPRLITDEFGLITDGDGDYLPNAGCGFIIAPAQREGTSQIDRRLNVFDCFPHEVCCVRVLVSNVCAVKQPLTGSGSGRRAMWPEHADSHFRAP
eukprot:2643287-Rhodomonas_salina.2